MIEEMINAFLRGLSETYDRNAIRKEIEKQQIDHDKRKLLFLLHIKNDGEQYKEIEQQRFEEWLRPFGPDHNPIIIDAIYEDIDWL